MNLVELEGIALCSDIVFLPEHDNVAVCRIVLKIDNQTCIPVFCFGKSAVDIKGQLQENGRLHVSGKLVTYLFHDAFDTEKLMTMVLGKHITVDNVSFVIDSEDMEKECFLSMSTHDMLPVSEAYYEIIANELSEMCW